MAQDAATPMLLAGKPIDPTDLSSWTVYDHYCQSATDASQPAGWTGHPWFGWNDQYGGTRFYDVTTAAGKASFEANVINGPRSTIDNKSPLVSRPSRHIYTTGTVENAAMTFIGYGQYWWTDWAIYPETRTDLKSVSFDIDANMVNPHTLDSFGIMLNAGTTGSTLKGYAISFRMANHSPSTRNGTLQLVNFSGGIDANLLHGGVTPGNVDTTGSTGSYQYISTAGSSSTIDSFDLNSSPVGKIHVDIDILPGSAVLKVAYFTDATTISTTVKTYNLTLPANTGFSGFGPYVNYSGDGHSCERLSFVRFGGMSMSNNYSVNFFPGYDNLPAIKSYLDIEPGKSMNYYSYPLPANPTRPGYYFTGWKTAEGLDFHTSDPINKITNVYAQWSTAAGPDITITGNPTAWTNKDVTLTVNVKSRDGSNLSTVTGTGGSGLNASPGAQTYTGSVTFTKNGTLKVDASTTYPLSATKSETVTKIDKTAPTITGAVEKQKVVTSSNFSVITFGDNGDSGTTSDASGVNNATKTLYLYKNSTDKTPFITIPWSQLSDLENRTKVPAGIYYYAVSVCDNATNYSDSRGKTGDNSTTPLTPDGPGDSGDPSDPGDYIIIGADAPVVTETNRSFPATGGWTNKDVIVDYNVHSNTVNLEWVKVVGIQIPTSGLDFPGKLTFIRNGTQTVEGSNIAHITGKHDFVVNNIDKKAPTISGAVPKKVVVTSSSFSVITFSDTGDSGTASDASGVNNATKYLYLYKKSTDTVPFLKLPWSDLSQLDNRSIVPAGIYYYAVSVCDNATNYSDSRGKTGDNSTTPLTPDGPGDGGNPGGPDDYIIIGGAPPTVKEKLPRTPLPASGYTNQDVYVTYIAECEIDLQWVKEAGGAVIPVTGATKTYYEGTLRFTENGSKVVDARNIANQDGSGTFTVSAIDKLNPTVTMPTNYTKFKYEDIKVADAPATATQAMSGIDKTTFTITEYRAGKPDPDPRYTYTGTWDEIASKMVNGATYDVTVVTVDKATNPSLPVKAVGVIFDDGKPRDTLSIIAAGDGTTATNIRYVVRSTGAPISLIKVGGPNGTQVYPGSTGSTAYVVTLDTAVTSGGSAVIYAECTDGTNKTETVTAKQVPSSPVIASFSPSMTVAAFTAAFNSASASPAVIQSREIIKASDGSSLTTALLARQPRPLQVYAKFTTTAGVVTYFGAGVSGPTSASVQSAPITIN